MGIIRKRLVTSSEPCGGVSPGDEPQEGGSAQPPGESASSSASTTGGQDKLKRRTKPSSDVTRPLTIVRMRSKPRQLTTVNETGAPDWSLSAGVATVLFGFAVAFGTYVTLTQRDAVQSRLHRVTGHDEPRAAARHDPPAPIEPLRDSELTSRNTDAAPTVPLSAKDAAPRQAKANRPASAAGGVGPHAPAATTAPPSLAAGTTAPPSLAGASAPPPTATRAAGQRAIANAAATPVPARQASTNTDDGLNPMAARARTTPPATPAPKERRVAQKAAKPACGPLKLCDEVIVRDDHVAHDPVNVRPSTKATAAATAVRDVASGVPAIQPGQVTPPIQSPAPTETAASLSASVNRELFRRH